MTHREAMKIALTELGLSKREIWQRMKFGDKEAGWTGNEPLTLKPGVTERDHIEATKASYLKFQALPKHRQHEVFLAMQDWHRRNIAGN